MTLEEVSMTVHRVTIGSSVVSYQAADPANARLLVLNSSYVCPVSHWPELLNTTAYGSNDRLETLQVRPKYINVFQTLIRVFSFVFFRFLPSRSPQWMFHLYLVLSSASSSVTSTTAMTSLTASTNHLISLMHQ